MVFDVAEVGVCEGRDGDGAGGRVLGRERGRGVGDVRGRGLLRGRGGLEERVGVVLAERVDQPGYRCYLGAEEGELRGEDVALRVSMLGKGEGVGRGLYRALEWAMVGSTRTSSSSSAMLSSYAVAMGMARSTMPSMMACITMLASPLRRSIVSGDCNRLRMGSSMTSAECSKNDTRVLSLWRKIDTCSTDTWRPFAANVEWSSMYFVRSSSEMAR